MWAKYDGDFIKTERAYQTFIFDSSKAYSIGPTAGDILVYKMPNGAGEIV